MMQVTRESLAAAHALARTFVDFLDRDYALAYISWIIRENARKQVSYPIEAEAKPIYQGIGSAERIEAAVDEALTA
jgi:hypothetical protein